VRLRLTEKSRIKVQLADDDDAVGGGVNIG
jgi:hypothetical protein